MAKHITIDIDKAIELYNAKNTLKMTKEGLFRKMESNLDRATVSNWKSGKVPKGFNKLWEVAELCNCNIDDILTIKEL